MILAADEQGGIGFKNGLPWPKIKEDLLSNAALQWLNMSATDFK